MARNLVSIGGELQVNLADPLNPSLDLTGSQDHAEVTALPNGNFVVVFESSRPGGSGDPPLPVLMWQEFTDSGSRLTGPNRLDFENNGPMRPDVDARSNSGFVAVWEQAGSMADPNGIRLAIVAPGTFSEPADFGVIKASGNNSYADPAVATLSNGSYFVAYEHNNSASSSTDIQIAVVNATATAKDVAAKDVTNVGPNSFAGNADVAATGNNAVVVWAQGPSANRDIKLKLIGPTGTLLDTETVIDNTVHNDEPSAATLSDGRVVVVWEGRGANLNEIFGRIYNPATGSFAGDTFTVTARVGNQTEPSVAALKDGGFVVDWSDSSATFGDASGLGVHARRFDDTGVAVGDEFLVNSGVSNNQRRPAIAANGDDVTFAVWTTTGTDNTTDTDPNGVQGQMLRAKTEVVLGTDGNDTIITYGLDEKIKGLDGNDTIDGRSGKDSLYGGKGHDLLTGGFGKDSFVFDVNPTKKSVDHIADFTHGDKIRLDHDIYKAIKVGALKNHAFYSHNHAHEAHDDDDRVIYDPKSGKLRYDDDGAGGHGAKVIAILDGSPNHLHHDDIVIIG